MYDLLMYEVSLKLVACSLNHASFIFIVFFVFFLFQTNKYV